MQDEIALFIDFENIRYSLLNSQRREPDPQELIAIARRFGTVMVARAYADWTRQPEFFKGSLTAAMIDRVDCPAKVRERVRPTQPYYQQQTTYDRKGWRDQAEPHDYPYEGDAEDEEDDEDLDGEPELLEEVDLAPADAAHDDEAVGETYDDNDSDDDDDDDDGLDDDAAGADVNGDRRQDQYNYQAQPFYNNGNGAPQTTSTTSTQSTVDLNMLMDIIETVFDRPNINTFVLMTGDRDFTRISARLKLRLNKRVIICGVPGSVSRDLISAAEQFIPLSYGAVAPSSGQYGGQPQGPMDRIRQVRAGTIARMPRPPAHPMAGNRITATRSPRSSRMSQGSSNSSTILTGTGHGVRLAASPTLSATPTTPRIASVAA